MGWRQGRGLSPNGIKRSRRTAGRESQDRQRKSEHGAKHGHT
jgi:hypothetical protein